MDFYDRLNRFRVLCFPRLQLAGYWESDLVSSCAGAEEPVDALSRFFIAARRRQKAAH